LDTVCASGECRGACFVCGVLVRGDGCGSEVDTDDAEGHARTRKAYGELEAERTGCILSVCCTAGFPDPLITSADEYVYLLTRLLSFNSIAHFIANRVTILRFRNLAHGSIIYLRPARQLLDPHGRTHARCGSQILLRGSVMRCRPIDVGVVLLVCPCRLCTGCQRLLEPVGPREWGWISGHCDFQEQNLGLLGWCMQMTSCASSSVCSVALFSRIGTMIYLPWVKL
jgi:hypothetical protein